MTRLAIDYPPYEYIIIVIAVLVGLIGKIVEVGRKVRQKSIESEQQAEAPFGFDLEEAPEPRTAEPAPKLELVRRPPRPRREDPVVAARPPPPPRPVAPQPPKPRQHEIVRLLRTPRNARTAVLLAEVLGPPKALRRDTVRGPMLRNS